MTDPVSIFWFRRDLRLDDNAGLHAALRAGTPVVPLFVFDRHILDVLEDRDDARVTFLHGLVRGLRERFETLGVGMEVHYGSPEKVWRELLERYAVSAAYANEDYEPYAKERDASVAELLRRRGADLHLYKDQVIFAHDEVTKKDGNPYTVFTPYSKVWRDRLSSKMDTDANGEEVSFYLKSYPSADYADRFAEQGALDMPSLADLGFSESDTPIPDTEVPAELIERYDETRDYPGIAGTSRLGPHLRHGSVSIRGWARRAQRLNETFLSELIWRDFYSQVLQHSPRVVSHSFKPAYENIPWENDEDHFAAWCEGRTGYPLVDAGMRQLRAIGYVHNRVRMVVASFLTKHLLTDWRWGEAHFARYLLDYELASNNGGWQWAAGCGTDASPYFRVFNPESQLRKFDPELTYVKQYVPEYGTDEYPAPIVDHREAREKAIRVYKTALSAARG